MLNNCYYVAVYVVPFNFICSMTIFRKSFILDLHLPLNLPRGSDPGIQSNIQSDLFHIYCFYLSEYKVSVIILKIDLVIAKFMYLTFDPA